MDLLPDGTTTETDSVTRRTTLTAPEEGRFVSGTLLGGRYRVLGLLGGDLFHLPAYFWPDHLRDLAIGDGCVHFDHVFLQLPNFSAIRANLDLTE